MFSGKNKRNSIKETEGVCLEKWTAKGSNKLWGLSEIAHCIAALAGFKNRISTVLAVFYKLTCIKSAIQCTKRDPTQYSDMSEKNFYILQF